MYLLFNKQGEFSGFSYGNLTVKEKEDGFNIKEITDEEHKTYIEKTNMKGYTYYLENDEVVERSPKPDLFHIWNTENRQWNYKKELEISVLEEELGILELEITNMQKEIKNLKESGKTFAAKKLEKENIELDKTYQEKLKRYGELEQM